jgi:hypothetical protein
MQTNNEKREQDSLAPVQLDRLTIEEEVAGMNRGKSARLLGVAMMVSALAVGGAWAMKRLDREQAENNAASVVASLRVQHVEAYLVCIAPEAPLAVFSSSERLHSALESLTERYQKAYARTLESCEPKLDGLIPALTVAPVAKRLEPAVSDLKAAAVAVQDGASDLRSYLADARRPYDYVEVTAFIDRLARASASYHKQDDALRTQLTR